MNFIYLMTLSGCFNEFPNTLAPTFSENENFDFDGDGQTEREGDCDDKDPKRYKDAPEVCDGIDNDCNEEIDDAPIDILTWYKDADSDGYGISSIVELACSQPDSFVDNDQDCDDTNSSVNPAEQEICDELDNNCNEMVDEYLGQDAPRWYFDGDGDGFGSSESTMFACDGQEPTGYVDTSLDCDDSNDQVYPNAPEMCDEVDNNCNTLVDEEGAVGAPIWYADFDGDGNGNSELTIQACSQPDSYVDNFGDCNDLNDLQSLGHEELCNGYDDNCDGTIDEGINGDAPSDALTWYLDSDSDGYGSVNTPSVQCDAPPSYVSNSEDCNDGDGNIHIGAPEYCNNVDDDCNGLVDDEALNLSTFYPDTDLDTHGDPNGPLWETCPTFDPISGLPTIPYGYSLTADDCDDTTDTRSPSNPELCTATVDENCDGDELLGAVDQQLYVADSDLDGFGDSVYSLSSCEQPLGYIAYNINDLLDCNDNDSEVRPGEGIEWELCNGKLDRCENEYTPEINGVPVPPENELDLDGDGFVECNLNVDVLQWENNDLIEGGGDCDNTNGEVFPDAPELCTGVFEDCNDVNYGSADAPDNELDGDGDLYVECEGYGATPWTGEPSILGGGDCNDNNPSTYPGVAFNTSTSDCLTDMDGDGFADCRFGGACDMIFNVEGVEQMDFSFISAGSFTMGSPIDEVHDQTQYCSVWGLDHNWGEVQHDVTLTTDFYMLNTEVTQGMFETVMGYNSIVGSLYTYGTSSEHGAYNVSWFMAADFANQLTTLYNAAYNTSLSQCYTCTDEMTDSVTCDSISIEDPYACSGFRLPTDAEWEYAARAGSTSSFWTNTGGGDIQQGQTQDCTGLPLTDGSQLGDYAWYCGNTGNPQSTSYGDQVVASKLPNGNGLFDIVGNLLEWSNDMAGIYDATSVTDPFGDYGPSEYRDLRGGHWNADPTWLRSSQRYWYYQNFRAYYIGFRLVRSDI